MLTFASRAVPPLSFRRANGLVSESLVTHSVISIFARAGGQAVVNVPKVVCFCIEHSFGTTFV